MCVFGLEVVQEPAAAADQHQEAAAGVMVLRVRLEMFCQVADAFAENRDLHFWGTGIAIVSLVGANQFGFSIFRQRHNPPPRALQTPCRPPDAPYTWNSVSRTSSTCYIRMTKGCKRPEAAAARASPMSSCAEPIAQIVRERAHVKTSGTLNPETDAIAVDAHNLQRERRDCCRGELPGRGFGVRDLPAFGSPAIRSPREFVAGVSAEL